MRNEHNSTLLHYAAYYNSISCLSLLLRFAPHFLDAVDNYNETPLMMAVMKDKIDAVEMLLQAGADSRKKNKYGRTAFDRARNNKEMLEIFKQHQQVKWNSLILLKL